jgi:hypothetical protein
VTPTARQVGSHPTTRPIARSAIAAPTSPSPTTVPEPMLRRQLLELITSRRSLKLWLQRSSTRGNGILIQFLRSKILEETRFLPGDLPSRGAERDSDPHPGAVQCEEC